jgi:predicted permease
MAGRGESPPNRLRFLHFLDDAWQDLRLGGRAFAQTPGVSALMVATLAVGIGATTAIFSVMNVLLLRPVAGVHDQGRLVSVERTPGQGIVDVFSYPDYRDLRARVASVDLAAFRRTLVDLRDRRGETTRVSGALVTDNYFSVLGVRAAIGRLLTVADVRADVVVISHACWVDRFGGGQDVLGTGVTINGHAFTIIGVTARGFDGTFPGQFDEVWLPLATQPVAMPRMSVGVLENRNSRWIQMVGRLSPQAQLRGAEAEIETADQALAQTLPTSHGGRLTLMAGLGLASDDRQEVRTFLGVLITGASLLLLVACGNVGNLILARSERRRRETATRRALGASPARMARQLLAEGLLLAFAGGGLGLALAPRIIGTLGALAQSAYGIGAEALAPDGRVLAFTILVSMMVAVGFTLAPAWHARATNPVDALRDGARGVAGRITRLRESLVVAQVALSATLLIGAGLSLRTIQRIDAVAAGYRTTGVVLASYTLDLQGYSAPAASRFFATLTTALQNAPGIRTASWATAVPPVEYGGRRSVFRAGEAPPQAELQEREETLGVRADFTLVGPDFFETMGIALARGRGFTAQDRDGGMPVAIVNDTLAARLWPGEDAIGRSLEAPPYSGPVLGPMLVVGVARDTHHRSLLETAHAPVIYLPFLQNPDQRATLVLRTAAGAAALEGEIRKETTAVDPNVAVATIQDLDHYVAATLWEQRTARGLFGMFGLIALFLSATGLHAIVSHAVAMRAREMGIRLALGASASGLVRLVVAHSMGLAAIGATIGVAVALAAGGAIRHVLFDVNPRDPVTLATAPLLLLLVALVASAAPARQAALADPSRALRAD